MCLCALCVVLDRSISCVLVGRPPLVAQLTERVTLKERTINKDFENLGAEFRQRQVELEQLSRDYEDLSQVRRASFSL